MRVVTVARKPLSESTLTANVLAHEVGALCIGRCRVGTEKISQHGRKAKGGTGWEDHWHNKLEGGRSWTGRWPSNIVLIHGDACEVVGERKVATGTAHREKSGGKTIFSETDKKPLPNMTYGDENGMESVPDWRCDVGCPVAVLEGVAASVTGNHKSTEYANERGSVARFFKQVCP